MTTPNPTPTTREREAAREIAYNLEYQSNGVNNPDVIDLGKLELSIAAALASERREALTEACKMVCDYCLGENSFYNPDPILVVGEWRHFGSLESYSMPCYAAGIRAAIERLRDGEKG